jgi:peptidoglycan/xylan/chitin deacetylase (PgdA/CDA1 family)
MPRLLELFRRFGLKQSWFIPGHTIESFPRETDLVAAAGHEIGPARLQPREPARPVPHPGGAIFDRCIGLIEQHWGRRPVGYVAPWVGGFGHVHRDPGGARHRL